MKYIFWICLALMYFSCELVVDIDVPKEKSKLTLNSYFTTDSLWYAKVSESKYILDDPGYYKPIDNALLIIYQNEMPVDTLVNKGDGTYQSDTGKPVNNDRYEIRAKAASFEDVSASSSIPIPVLIQNIEVKAIQDGYSIKLKFMDRKGVENFYKVMIDVETSYTNDQGEKVSFHYPVPIQSDDPLFNDSESQNEFIFTDGLFADKALTLNINTRLYLPDDTKAVLHLITLSKDMYQHEKTLKLQEDTTGDPFAQPVNVYKNVENGYGVFGGFSESIYQLNN